MRTEGRRAVTWAREGDTRGGCDAGLGASRGPRGRAGKTGQRWVRSERERGSSSARRVAEAGQRAVWVADTGAEWGQKVAPDLEDRGGLGSEAEMVLRLGMRRRFGAAAERPTCVWGTRVAA